MSACVQKSLCEVMQVITFVREDESVKELSFQSWAEFYTQSHLKEDYKNVTSLVSLVS